jgi:hypothetical protein
MRVGITFREESFSAATATPEHRLHQRAAPTVLKALLPPSGTDIKGEMHSRRGPLKSSRRPERTLSCSSNMRIPLTHP